MKKLLVLASVVVLSVPVLAQNYPLYVAGDFNSWNAAGNVMTLVNPGIWQVTLTGVSGRHEFKITEGDWNWNYPGPNSWFYGDANGNVTLTYDQNTYNDGWSASTPRIGESTDPGAWTAAGDFQGWNNAAGNMTALGGGIYEYTLTTPGSWNWKPVVTGTWDSISWDNRSVGTANWAVTINPGEEANLYVNAYQGTASVEIVPVPEPSTLALSTLAGLTLLMAARKRK